MPFAARPQNRTRHQVQAVHYREGFACRNGLAARRITGQNLVGSPVPAARRGRIAIARPSRGRTATWVPLLASPAVISVGIGAALLEKPAVAPFFNGLLRRLANLGGRTRRHRSPFGFDPDGVDVFRKVLGSGLAA